MERYIERPQENARRKGVIWSGIRKDTVVSRDKQVLHDTKSTCLKSKKMPENELNE